MATSNKSILFFNKIELFTQHFRFGKKAQLAFLEDLHALINDGIPANHAIEMMAKIGTGLSSQVALSLADKIAEGQLLANGMQEWFAPSVVEIIRVGEVGGALAQTMKSAINTMSQQGVAVGSFISAITYPIIVIVMACGIISYLNNSVFTQFLAIKPMAEWPEAGQQLVALAAFIHSWWWTVILGIIVLFLFLRWTMINYIGPLRINLDKIPPFTFYKRFLSARLLETLGLLVANGVVFKAAITILQYQAKPYLLQHLITMEQLLSAGKTNIGDVLNTGLITYKDLMRLRIMAEVKGFEHGLIRLGIRGSEQATETLKLISKVVGGMLLGVGGILIIMIIRGIFMTGMSMGS